MQTMNIHNVRRIRFTKPRPLNGECFIRDIRIETADGHLLEVTCFADRPDQLTAEPLPEPPARRGRDG